MNQKEIKDMTINERISYFRKIAGLTQAEVAKKMEMKVGTYSKMEREGKITVDKLIKLAQILDVDYDLLVNGEEKETKVEYIPVPIQTSANTANTLFQPIMVDNTPKSRIPEYIPTARERATMQIIHNMPKKVQEEIYDFIKKKMNECGK